jgi:hypothetical protein
MVFVVLKRLKAVAVPTVIVNGSITLVRLNKKLKFLFSLVINGKKTIWFVYYVDFGPFSNLVFCFWSG